MAVGPARTSRTTSRVSQARGLSPLLQRGCARAGLVPPGGALQAGQDRPGHKAGTAVRPPPKAVLFDIGGTLLEYVPEASPAGLHNARQGCQRAYEWLQEQGKTLPDFETFLRRHWQALRRRRFWYYLRGRELRFQSIVLRTLTRMGVEVRPEEVYDLTECYYRTFGDTLHPLPGARETLAELAGLGLRLAVISNTAWPGYLLEDDLARFGLLEHVEFCLFSSYVGWRKPRRRIFEQALKMLKVSPAEAIFVGDSLKHDIRGAQRVGMRAVLLASERPGDLAQRRTKPDWTISELAELVPIVARESLDVKEAT